MAVVVTGRFAHHPPEVRDAMEADLATVSDEELHAASAAIERAGLRARKERAFTDAYCVAIRTGFSIGEAWEAATRAADRQR